ncbi:MAG: MarR family transcriptional regulator, partial [Acidobacteria bacterium]|nr:MarR family transcriptional regulator [Acidobacteriota bacterium]
VSLPHFRVLVLLETGGPARVGRLAEQLGVVFSTFSRSLDRLEAGGWVERAHGIADRREITVSISARGRRLVRMVTSQRSTELEVVLARVPDADRAVLERAFSAFADIAGEPTRSEMLVLGI